ncbi:protease modulator HflC [Octadecabacter sp.]|nr:protease modulator HflC [Octadecabacter sp.]
MNRSTYILPVIVIAVAAILSSIFIVDERQKALVLQFGQIVSVKEDPGIGFKIPLVQEVVFYDDRILALDVDPLEVTPLDDRRLIVDAFARYRITDVERFRQAVGTGGEETAARRLDSILRSETREVLGSVSSNDILSTDRAALMLRIRNAAISEANALGVTIIDVRLKRTDLPSENLNATFQRMVAERAREAEDERARGREAAQRIEAQADRTVVELVSEASREARIIEGEADALRNNIFAQAYGQDAEFFQFYRSLEAYGIAIGQGNARLVLSPDHEFFNYLRNENGTITSDR